MVLQDSDFFYEDYTVRINGVFYRVDMIPDSVHATLSYPDTVQINWFLMDYRFQDQEEWDRNIMERNLRIIGFASTMSRILHSKEDALKKNNEKKQKTEGSSSF